MANKTVTVEERKLGLDERVEAGVNVTLIEHTGAPMVALGCHACGLFLGYEHNANAKDTCTGGKAGPDGKPVDETDPPHEPVKATRFDAMTVKVAPKTGRLVAGREIPAEESIESLDAKIAALQEQRKAAAAKAAAEKG